MLAPCPSQPPQPIPYGHVSLLDMMNFNLHAFMWTLKLIRQEWAIAEGRIPTNDLDGEMDGGRLLDNLKGIARTLNPLFIAEDRLATLFQLTHNLGRYEEIAHELKALDSDVLSAARYERFYHYPREKGLLVLRVPGDWAATLKAFPSSEEDVKAAVDCYALGHNRASIHHSMMVLEFGLPALARRLKAPFNPNKGTWKDITKSIQEKIDEGRASAASTKKGAKPPTRSQAKARSAFLDACEEAAIEFRYFTSVWRNHVAHGRGDYDENDAKKVLEHVRTFMEIIATKLKLKEPKR